MEKISNILQSIIYGNKSVAVVRILIGILFIYSGFFKALAPDSFLKSIIQFDILPLNLAPYVAIVLPYIEIMLGLFLFVGFRIRSISFIGLILMIAFTIGLSVTVARGQSFDCGCFELSWFGFSEEVSIKLVIRDIIFVIFFVILFRARKHYYSIDNVIEEDELSNI